MDIPVEAKIHLNKFKPRDYQRPIFKAFFEDKYRRMVLVLPRRCVSAETYVSMANGSVKKISDVVAGDRVLSFDGKKTVSDTVMNVWSVGEKEALRIKSKKFPDVVVSKDHKFFTVGTHRRTHAWKTPLELISPSGVCQNLTCLGVTVKKSKTMGSSLLAEFIGYLTHDGYVVGYQQPKFTNTNIDLLKRVEFLAAELFSYTAIWRKKGNGYDLGLTNGTRGGGTFKNKVKELFRTVGLDIQKSRMRVHPCMWEANEEEILAYIRAVISCDGSIYARERRLFEVAGRQIVIKPGCEIKISCGKSKALAIDTYWLLRKIGIIPQRVKLEKTSNWLVRVSRYDGVIKILAGKIYGKEDKRKKALESIEKAATRQPADYKDLRVLTKYAVEPAEECEMYDLETKKNHNFFANGYLVHNSGKDLCTWNIIIREAITHVGVYYYIFPTYSQGKKIIWNSVTIQGERFLDYIPRQLVDSVNSQEMRVILTNGSIIQIIGSEKADALVGSNPCGIVFSEYALQNPRVYALMAPILAANKGWAIFNSTPRGKNSFWELYQLALNSPDWWTCKLGLDETKHIDPKEIDREIEEGLMSPDLVQQEFYCSFLAGVEGSYYCKYVDKMRLNNQIGVVPWEPGFSVHTAWDIGVRDSTSIIFFQTIGQTVRIIDSYEKNKEGLEHYVKHVLSKDYTYGKHIAPHDIAVQEFGSGVTRIEKAKQLGIRFTVASKISIMDGIETVRSTLGKMWIDEGKCKTFIRSLENYRQEYDNKRQVYKDQPLHDIHSNFCDALRYLCISLPKTRDGMSADDLDRLRNEAMYGDQSSLPSFFRDGIQRF